MIPSAHKTTPQNRTQTMRFYSFVSTGKERDEETGYGYFGARYMDHELMTMWLSVDPMADKYPSISPYAYCAWNPVKLVDSDGRDFDPTMEEYANKVISFCDNKIKSLSEKESLTDEEKDCLSEFQSTKEEIEKMRNDHSTYYCVQSGSFGEKERKTKGVTQYYGCGEFTRKGQKQHKIMVSLHVDCGLFTEEGGLNMKGLFSFVHELKHCYQFYHKESLYVQSPEGGIPKVYNTQALEEAAFRRAAAFGCDDRFYTDYPGLFKGTMDEFIQENPGCTVIKHK